ncbi:MAG: hypothetical protein LBV58_01130 [Acholeplasmatales bacterium]|jgi:hypothetical protein|nr:hypothetical protein [Acholeplasmatales bacterium]
MGKKILEMRRTDLNCVFNSEKNFNNWLVCESALQNLSKTTGIIVKSPKREFKSGDLYIDILAFEEKTDNKIIIESQFNDSDHAHLGKLLTYGMLENAKFLIWVVENPLDEHILTIQELNKKILNFEIILVQATAYESFENAQILFTLTARKHSLNYINKRIIDDKISNEKTEKRKPFWTIFERQITSLNFPYHGHTVDNGIAYSFSLENPLLEISISLSTSQNVIKCLFWIIKKTKESVHIVENLVKNIKKIENELEVEITFDQYFDSGKTAFKYVISDSYDYKNESNYEELAKLSLKKVLETITVFKKNSL